MIAESPLPSGCCMVHIRCMAQIGGLRLQIGGQRLQIGGQRLGGLSVRVACGVERESARTHTHTHTHTHLYTYFTTERERCIHTHTHTHTHTLVCIHPGCGAALPITAHAVTESLRPLPISNVRGARGCKGRGGAGPGSQSASKSLVDRPGFWRTRSHAGAAGVGDGMAAGTYSKFCHGARGGGGAGAGEDPRARPRALPLR